MFIVDILLDNDILENVWRVFLEVIWPPFIDILLENDPFDNVWRLFLEVK